MCIIYGDKIYSNNLYDIHKDILNMFELPYKIQKKIKIETFLEKLIENLYNDKKRNIKGFKFILAKEIGLGTIKFINDKNLIKNSF